MKTRELIGVLSTAVLLSACAMGQKHAFGTVDPNLQVSGEGQLSVATLDHRPYIVSGDKQVTFVGLQRGGFGNTFDIHTVSGQPMSADITDSLSRALQGSGFEVRTIDTQPQQSEADVIKRLTGDSRAVLLTFTELKSDTYNNVAFHYDMDLKVVDSNGEVIADSTVSGRDHLGGSFMNPAGHAKQAVPQALQKKLELLLNDPEVVEALR